MGLQKQIDLEREMIDLGTKKYIDGIDLKNEFDSVHTQIVVSKIIKPFSDMILYKLEHEIQTYKKGPIPTLIHVSKSGCNVNKDKTPITADQISFIVCRSLFNGIRRTPQKMVRMASEIGDNINQNLIESDKLSQSQSFKIGVILIDLFCEGFPDLLYYEIDWDSRKEKNKQYLIKPTQDYLEFVEEKVNAIADLTTVIFPMIYKPCDWNSDGKNGGFYTEHLKSNIVKRKRIDEPSGINDKISNYINLIQSTPWKVNDDIYPIMLELNKTKPSTLSKIYPVTVPENDPRPFDKELLYSDMDDVQKKEHQKWSKRCSRNEKAREAKKSIDIGVYSSMRQAKKFINESSIYFPHDIDYRDRAYNMCMTGLNTQGSDIQKGLIQFADGKPVHTDHGIRWMCINLANLVGHDKLLLDERYAWTLNNEALFRDIAKDPLKCDLWHSWDKPVQGLSACIEYVKWLDNPDMNVRTHVQLDG